MNMMIFPLVSIEIPLKTRAFSSKKPQAHTAPRLIRVAHGILATAAAGPGLAHR